MNEQMNRALYIGCALLLLVLAFTSFFSLYRDYRDYASRVREYTDTPGVATMETFSGCFGDMTGHEVANLLLARRRTDRERILNSLYEDTAGPSEFGELPELVIDGESYEDFRLESIDPDGTYQADIRFNAYGRPVRIEIRGR
ncbi:hypothetical protein [Thermoclostridium caenicola]|uniref:Uncharacterized protein n=1 Tax=Thermoclostridium caenicola TaxID=659425 RepID=A0A1M6F291_9FIRM|nr:hypothetical protein [Thermoclostridium caenicola]SHI91790.1 hypothetical protein SAMN05444373_10154 [Thermoclostridium caenicola]